MGLDKIEVLIHDMLIKTPVIRHFLYGLYQRAVYLFLPKINIEGNIQRITPNDGKEYFFGYYDKSPWDRSERYLLCLRVNDSKKFVAPKEPADIVLIDTVNNEYKKLTSTRTWNVQQGCMLQWVGPDYSSKILYNDYRNGKYCSVIMDLDNKIEKVIDRAVYSVSEDGKTALSLDFSRLHRLRPGYGYSNLPDKSNGENCPNDTCIWSIDLISGEIKEILKYTDFENFQPRSNMRGAEHKVNHIMLSPDGKRFMVLHRWLSGTMKYTRLITCNINGTDMYNLSDDDFVSHCCWKSNNEILSYLNKNDSGKGYYLMVDKTQDYQKMWPELVMDGHPSFSPNNKYAVTDTYPNRQRLQSVYIMNGEKVKCVSRAFSPFKYGGDIRCDLHPRWSRVGNKICIDATFEGRRGMYILNSVDI